MLKWQSQRRHANWLLRTARSGTNSVASVARMDASVRASRRATCSARAEAGASGGRRVAGLVRVGSKERFGSERAVAAASRALAWAVMRAAMAWRGVGVGDDGFGLLCFVEEEDVDPLLGKGEFEMRTLYNEDNGDLAPVLPWVFDTTTLVQARLTPGGAKRFMLDVVIKLGFCNKEKAR